MKCSTAKRLHFNLLWPTGRVELLLPYIRLKRRFAIISFDQSLYKVTKRQGGAFNLTGAQIAWETCGQWRPANRCIVSGAGWLQEREGVEGKTVRTNRTQSAGSVSGH